MIKKDQGLDIPHGNTTIWRYLSLEKFLDMLVTKELFFTNAARMTDKYEGIMPKRNQEYRIKELIKSGLTRKEAELEYLAKAYEINSLRKLTLLNCWTMKPHESYALWKIYLGGSNTGVAVMSTVSKLIRAIQKGNDEYDEEIYYSKVNYTDFITDDIENRLNIITTKNKFYDYEKEMRLFIFHHHLSEGGVKPPYNISVGRRLQIDIEELISEIYVSPFSGRWFDNTFKRIIKKINPQLVGRIKNSEILDK
jgi:hypothetical protein